MTRSHLLVSLTTGPEGVHFNTRCGMVLTKLAGDAFQTIGPVTSVIVAYLNPAQVTCRRCSRAPTKR